MNKEQYVQGIKALDTQEECIAINRKLITDSYIKECGGFLKGDAVSRTYSDGRKLKGFISSVEINPETYDIKYCATEDGKHKSGYQEVLAFWEDGSVFIESKQIALYVNKK